MYFSAVTWRGGSNRLVTRPTRHAADFFKNGVSFTHAVPLHFGNWLQPRKFSPVRRFLLCTSALRQHAQLGVATVAEAVDSAEAKTRDRVRF